MKAFLPSITRGAWMLSLRLSLPSWLAVLLLTAACSKQEPAPPAPAAQSGAPAAAVSAKGARLSSAGKLTVCSDIPYAPFEFNQGDKLTGSMPGRNERPRSWPTTIPAGWSCKGSIPAPSITTRSWTRQRRTSPSARGARSARCRIRLRCAIRS